MKSALGVFSLVFFLSLMSDVYGLLFSLQFPNLDSKILKSYYIIINIYFYKVI